MKSPGGLNARLKTMRRDNSGERSEAVSVDYQQARVALFLSTLERRGSAGRVITGP